ncbi:MAG: endopeptidase La [Deltaproteobacteria bacterium]|nr:MAG: endopeptidase La [Deltaproteobacteria bacterium]
MINLPKIFKINDSDTVILPLLPLRDTAVFPHMVAPLFVGRDKSIKALSEAMHEGKMIFLATQKRAGVDTPESGDINRVGVVASLLQLLRLPDGTVKALVEGKARGRINRFVTDDTHFRVEVSPLISTADDPSACEALRRMIVDIFAQYAKLNTKIVKEVVAKVSALEDPDTLVDTLSAHLPFQLAEKQALLEVAEVQKRLSMIFEYLKKEVELLKVGQKIKGRVKSQIEKNQKHYYLNEQMRAIKREMGADDSHDNDLSDLEKRIKRKRMSKEAGAKVRQELKKLKQMPPMSAEATVVRNYVEWLISLPWFDKTRLRKDMAEAEAVLDSDHFGLEKPKERILEYLAVQQLVKKIRGPILCLVGPPGVGKTSLAKSVARATNRKFIRISLGGVRDEAEIRGHRRTYIGAMPGKIIQSLKKAGKSNPVFCLDEIDKMSTDFRGDPSSALLEVLDPEQNNAFNDHYLEVDTDLSDVLFITTANTLHDIPAPLQDRMEIIRIPGYTEYEKEQIAAQFLIPKQIAANGLGNLDIRFSKNAVLSVIREYTRESGVRSLERELASICRKIAREVVKADVKNDAPIQVSTPSVHKYLGVAKFRHGQVEDKDQIGMVTGLAWTQFGGELLCIETVIMPGRGELTVTGKLGEVMQESARAAFSYVRSRTSQLGIPNDFYKRCDIHIHVPEGAIPKDGPSAGIAMCTSLVSALTRRPVRRDVAMTGEITLRGRVLPIGGLKEKALAAHRGGIGKVILPMENAKDIKDIPSTITRQVELIPMEHMDDVLTAALVLEDGDVLFTNMDMGDFLTRPSGSHVSEAGANDPAPALN